uniref:Uncharacterized protein n=1 Tax=Rhizophora mucronata TaxID=61149 RepID=A0A2P2LWZ1_RHIMU
MQLGNCWRVKASHTMIHDTLKCAKSSTSSTTSLLSSCTIPLKHAQQNISNFVTELESKLCPLNVQIFEFHQLVQLKWQFLYPHMGIEVKPIYTDM